MRKIKGYATLTVLMLFALWSAAHTAQADSVQPLPLGTIPAIHIRAQTSTLPGASYIDCEVIQNGSYGSNYFNWSALIGSTQYLGVGSPTDPNLGCTGVPNARMSALYVDGTASKAATYDHAYSPIDSCGAGSVLDNNGASFTWSLVTSCADPSMATSVGSCNPCLGSWVIQTRYGMVFPLSYTVTYMTPSSSAAACKLTAPNQVYCDVYGTYSSTS